MVKSQERESPLLSSFSFLHIKTHDDAYVLIKRELSWHLALLEEAFLTFKSGWIIHAQIKERCRMECMFERPSGVRTHVTTTCPSRSSPYTHACPHVHRLARQIASARRLNERRMPASRRIKYSLINQRAVMMMYFVYACKSLSWLQEQTFYCNNRRGLLGWSPCRCSPRSWWNK